MATAGIAAILLPIVQIIYNSVQWEDAKIKDSPIAVWLMIQMGIGGAFVIFTLVMAIILTL